MSSVINSFECYEDKKIKIEQSSPISGSVNVAGAKNAVLVILASLLLTDGKSTIRNVPFSADVLNMIELLRWLGATVTLFPEEQKVEVDTSLVSSWSIKLELMRKMRASVLVMGPLLQRFKIAEIALPGGCSIGERPVDFHIKAFARFGVELAQEHECLYAHASVMHPARLALEYPSVGATENVLMLASMIPGISTIVNASLEPEVLDLIAVLTKMGAHITIKAPATLEIEGVGMLKPIDHTIIPDRLEAGSLLLAAALTKGEIFLNNVYPEHMDVFLEKLSEMGHRVSCNERTIKLTATDAPRAVSFRTSPYPGFPTDLQAPMMIAQCLAQGKSIVHETVFENRLLHVKELQKMGAHIEVSGDRAIIVGVNRLYGAGVIASDIRASCALVLAGLAAQGTTLLSGLHHWRRGYDQLEAKLNSLGAKIAVVQEDT